MPKKKPLYLDQDEKKMPWIQKHTKRENMPQIWLCSLLQKKGSKIQQVKCHRIFFSKNTVTNHYSV